LLLELQPIVVEEARINVFWIDNVAILPVLDKVRLLLVTP